MWRTCSCLCRNGNAFDLLVWRYRKILCFLQLTKESWRNGRKNLSMHSCYNIESPQFELFRTQSPKKHGAKYTQLHGKWTENCFRIGYNSLIRVTHMQAYWMIIMWNSRSRYAKEYIFTVFRNLFSGNIFTKLLL